MKRILHWIDLFEESVASVALWGFTTVSFLQVIARYVFNNALAWPEEMGRYFLICMSFFGISMVMRTNEHLRVEVLTAFVPKKVVMGLNLFSATIIALFCLYTTYQGCLITMMIYELEQTAMSMDFEVWITWLPIPLGFFLMLIQLIRYEVTVWQTWKTAPATEPLPGNE